MKKYLLIMGLCLLILLAGCKKVEEPLKVQEANTESNTESISGNDSSDQDGEGKSEEDVEEGEATEEDTVARQHQTMALPIDQDLSIAGTTATYAEDEKTLYIILNDEGYQDQNPAIEAVQAMYGLSLGLLNETCEKVEFYVADGTGAIGYFSWDIDEYRSWFNSGFMDVSHVSRQGYYLNLLNNPVDVKLQEVFADYEEAHWFVGATNHRDDGAQTKVNITFDHGTTYEMTYNHDTGSFSRLIDDIVFTFEVEDPEVTVLLFEGQTKEVRYRLLDNQVLLVDRSEDSVVESPADQFSFYEIIFEQEELPYVHVGDVEALIDAIGPLRRIVYTNTGNERFDLKSAQSSHPYVIDGVISGVKYMTIEGAGDAKVPMVINLDQDVLAFEDCQYLTLRNLSIGHTDIDECSADAITAVRTTDLVVDHCELHGCGNNGLSLTQGSHVFVANSRVHGSSSAAILVSSDSELSIEDSLIDQVPYAFAATEDSFPIITLKDTHIASPMHFNYLDTSFEAFGSDVKRLYGGPMGSFHMDTVLYTPDFNGVFIDGWQEMDMAVVDHISFNDTASGLYRADLYMVASPDMVYTMESLKDRVAEDFEILVPIRHRLVDISKIFYRDEAEGYPILEAQWSLADGSLRDIGAVYTVAGQVFGETSENPYLTYYNKVLGEGYMDGYDNVVYHADGLTHDIEGALIHSSSIDYLAYFGDLAYFDTLMALRLNQKNEMLEVFVEGIAYDFDPGARDTVLSLLEGLNKVLYSYMPKDAAVLDGDSERYLIADDAASMDSLAEALRVYMTSETVDLYLQSKGVAYTEEEILTFIKQPIEVAYGLDSPVMPLVNSEAPNLIYVPLLRALLEEDGHIAEMLVFDKTDGWRIREIYRLND